MKVIATVISYVLHPLLLTTYLVLFLGLHYPVILGIRSDVLVKFSLFVFLVTFIFPVLNVALMFRLAGNSPSLTMPTRKSRIGPFVFITFIYCFFTGLFLYKGLLGIYFNQILIIIATLVTVGTVVTFFFKISIHSLAMGGVAGIMLALNRMTAGILLYPLIAVVLLTGIVMSARLVLDAHTLREVLYGVGIGFLIGVGGMSV